MKITYLTSLFFSFFIVCLTPSFMRSEAFGYVGIKTGYSHEMLSKTSFAGGVAYLNATSAVGIPFGVNVGFGYQFISDFSTRLEAEYLYRNGKKFRGGVLYDVTKPIPTSDGITLQPQAEIQTWMANFYADYYVTPLISLYLGAGIGKGLIGVTTHFRFGHSNPFGKIAIPFEENLVWQAGFGIGYVVIENLRLDFNLRYVDFGQIVFVPNKNEAIQATYPFSAVEALFGVNYRF